MYAPLERLDVKFPRPAVITRNRKVCHTNNDTSASIFISWCVPCCWSVSCCCRSVLLSAYIFNLCCKSIGLKRVFPHVPAKTVYCGHVASRQVNWESQQSDSTTQQAGWQKFSFPCSCRFLYTVGWLHTHSGSISNTIKRGAESVPLQTVSSHWIETSNLTT